MFRRLTRLAALTATFAGALTLATASPAQAAAEDCISYLQGEGQQTTTRNVICEETEALSDNVSPQYAYYECFLAMRATGLASHHADEACAQAIL